MSRVRFTPAARAELIEAQRWYETASPGLGQRFVAEIDRTIARMIEGPTRLPLVYKTLRRARVHVFPYALFYCIEGDTLLVVACFHSRRKPMIWQSRI